MGFYVQLMRGTLLCSLSLSLSMCRDIIIIFIINLHIILLANVLFIYRRLYAHEILSIHTWKVVMLTML